MSTNVVKERKRETGKKKRKKKRKRKQETRRRINKVHLDREPLRARVTAVISVKTNGKNSRIEHDKRDRIILYIKISGRNKTTVHEKITL